MPITQTIPKITHCEDCNVIISPIIPNEFYLPEYNKTVCFQCLQKYYVKCTDCNSYYLPEDLKRDPEDSENEDIGYCETCFNDKFRQCDACGDYHEADYSNYCEDCDRCYCESCFDDSHAQCDDCQEYRCDENIIEIGNNSSVCRSCLDTGSYYCCDNCNEYYHENDGFFRDEGYYCSESCAPEENNAINSYMYKPAPNFKFIGKQEKLAKNDTFGIELEIENVKNTHYNDEIAEEITDYFDNFVYCKSDGSLDSGFEIVTHPFTWKWYKKNKDKFNKIFDLRKKGYRSHDPGTCGMHIHISKKSFSTIHLYKLLKFFYDMDINFIKKISQRKKYDYCSLEKEDKTVKMAKKKKTNERYTAVNITDKTVEIRILNGTLRADRFYKNMEFVKAMFKFTKYFGIQEITKSNFIKFVHNCKTYKNLSNFIKEKGL